MGALINDWFKRQFSDPEVIGLVLVILITFILFKLVGGILSPLIISVVVAYLLNDTVEFLTRHKCPHTLAVILTCLFFVGILYSGIFVLLPLMWEQLSHLFNEIPRIIALSNDLITQLNQRFPDFIPMDYTKQIMLSFKSELGMFGHVLVSYSLSSLTSIISIIVYLLLVPIMVFFLLKDSSSIIHWFSQFIPKRRRLISQVWHEVDDQIGKYIRAKVIEIVIVATVSTLTFALFGLKYAILLGVISGLSVLIPYVGVVVVTVPVLIVAFLQWGFVAKFGYLTACYLAIMILDGHVLSMILFSEAVKLHPIAVIVSILFFGSLWGFWGVFFAIPLATLVKAIINAFASIKPR